MNVNSFFEIMAKTTTEWAGSTKATVLSFIIIIVWTIGGFWFGFGTDYQMYINSLTTIITFLMVFLLQRSHNKDSLTIQIKLNNIISSIDKADNSLLDVEDMSESDVRKIAEYYKNLAKDLEKNC